MRPTLVLAASALVASLASTTLAQPAPPPPSSLPPVVDPEPSAAASQMAALDARIATDSNRYLSLVAVDLAQGDARMRAIRPALAFHGSTFLPNFYLGVPRPYSR